MRLPNAERAFVDIAKLRDYALSPSHKEGRHKSRVFAAALGLTKQDADWLRHILLDAVQRNDCQLGRATRFGQRYIVDFSLTKGGHTALVRSVWNIPPSHQIPRLITCHVV